MDEKDPEYVSTLKYFHSLQSQPERLSEMASKEDAIV